MQLVQSDHLLPSASRIVGRVVEVRGSVVVVVGLTVDVLVDDIVVDDVVVDGVVLVVVVDFRVEMIFEVLKVLIAGTWFPFPIRLNFPLNPLDLEFGSK
jgi:hypothetical protein